MQSCCTTEGDNGGSCGVINGDIGNGIGGGVMVLVTSDSGIGCDWYSGAVFCGTCEGMSGGSASSASIMLACVVEEIGSVGGL